VTLRLGFTGLKNKGLPKNLEQAGLVMHIIGGPARTRTWNQEIMSLLL
jgi:hypothetical protein